MGKEHLHQTLETLGLGAVQRDLSPVNRSVMQVVDIQMIPKLAAFTGAVSLRASLSRNRPTWCRRGAVGAVAGRWPRWPRPGQWPPITGLRPCLSRSPHCPHPPRPPPPPRRPRPRRCRNRRRRSQSCRCYHWRPAGSSPLCST